MNLCGVLWRVGLVRPYRGKSGQWELAVHAGTVTLEDVLRYAIAEQAERAKSGKPGALADKSAALVRDVDLLVMQASMGIDQSVLQHLRQFSLDRIKVGASEVFPSEKRDTPGDDTVEARYGAEPPLSFI